MENKITTTAEAPPIARATLYREVASLASECESRQEYFSRVMKLLAVTFTSPFAAIYVRSNTEIFEDHWHQGTTDPAFWKPVMQDAITAVLSSGQHSARLLSAHRSSLTLGLIAVPLPGAGGDNDGALALIAKMTEQQVRENVSVLESLVAVMMNAARDVSRPSAESSARAPGSGGGLLKAVTCESPAELAFSMTASLRTNLGCQQVALGLVTGPRVRILAISGQEEVKGRTPGALAISQAMEECLDEGRPIIIHDQSKPADPSARQGHRLHRQWHYEARNAPVASMPLKVGEKTVAILSLQHWHGADISDELIRQVVDNVQPFVTILLLLDRAHRSAARHVWESGISSCSGLLSRGHYLRKVAWTAVLATCLWLIFGGMHYQVSVTAAVKPARLHHVGMPYDGVLASVEKRPGDRVGAGEIVCRLDSRELELQRAELAAELVVAEQEARRAMAVKTPADTRLAELEANVLRVKLATVENRIERATIRSPIDGILVEGDLRTKVGSVMTQGTPLAQVAPDDQWLLELRIPDSACSDIQPGLSGRFASQARPDSIQTFDLDLVQPNAVTGDKQVVFLAEARIENPEPWLRPGMEGVAKVGVGRRPAWWVLFHSVIDYVRINLWL